MYINFKLLEKQELLPHHIVYLYAIKQGESEYLIKHLTALEVEYFEDLELISYVQKKKKSDHLFTTIRLSKRGKKTLDELGEAEVEVEDKTVFEWLKKHYLKMGKEIGNGAKTQRHIRDFRIKTGIEKNNLLKLCLTFLQDEDNMQYNNILEYAFYKAPTAFETKFNIEESRLYKYYLKREDYFKSIFEEY